ncbi:GyrI-like domain-containing protein [Maribacter sp. R77961]|uniref:GyrI-like domain-containing protein n=1 Tax=Maribacter sp. R77961 TaxID=3093871 RepID=UPI0037C7DA41
MKKTIFIVLGLIAIFAIWYLFIKSHDYRINAKTKSSIGTINQTLKLWNGTLDEAVSIAQQESLTHLSQRIIFGDSTHQYEWYINPIDDSTATIKVDVTDQEHSMANRLQIPFSDTDFEKRSRKTVRDFLIRLREHQESFKITLADTVTLQTSYCACIEAESTQFEKASKMMENFPFLNSVFTRNNIKMNGVPLIEVTNWNTKKDSISFNFCYPLIKNDSLPQIKGIFYKSLRGTKALKAIYNGNYITSDRAWYALVSHAERNNLEIEKAPIEFFFNNPNMGGNEMRWKTEVFMPLK